MANACYLVPMASSLQPPPAPGANAPDLHAFEHHWQDEADAAFLYDVLAHAEPDERKRDLYRKLSEVEQRHVEIWGNLLRANGREPDAFKPTFRARVLATLGRRIGPHFLLPMLLQEEGREVKAYLAMHRATPGGVAGKGEALTLARESAEHATTLAGIAGRAGEPWHKTGSGGFLRNVVYGFNDGLTANFGLVAGVAGRIADALSMGASGYLAAKSEQEVYEHEIAMERDEIAMMPEVERDELALIYESQGMDREPAMALATQVMADPQRMLDEQVQEELGIAEPHMSPLREGWVTGLATAFGAVIPVFPFFFFAGLPAIVVAFVLSMASHWIVGAAR